MTKLRIDDIEIDVPPNMTLLQACEEAGAEIPRFCYHERLSIAGNCRMCLVEVVGMPKPMASCALNVSDLRPGTDGSPPHVRTRSETVEKARQGVMEFLLINHPLDCPICDQGGECDLQDQAMGYGIDANRFEENKRAVENKYIGPLIKTIMTRCIHCTRCVRFMTEVAGVPELGATGRGEDMEFTTYLEQGLMSELSGNVIDLCPVGALTSRPYAFKARPWELRKTESIDVMDAVGSNIRIDARGREVMRILPRVNDAVNEEWISDKARYIWDGLRSQRLDRPYIRKDGRLTAASWDEAFAAIATRMSGLDAHRFAAVAGDMATAEEMFALKLLTERIGSPNIDCRQDGARVDPSRGRASYLFNPGIAGIDEAVAILIVGANPRLEASVLNARIHHRYRQSGLPVGLIGSQVDLTYPATYLGAGPDSLATLADDTDGFAETLRNASRPMLILGSSALARPDGQAVLALAARIACEFGMTGQGDWNGFAMLHHAASRVAGLDLGLVPAPDGIAAWEVPAVARARKLDVVYLLGADELPDMDFGDAFVVYQGSHGDRGAHAAHVILPGSAYTEKDGIFVNTEGRVQMTTRAVFPPGDAKDDWAILRALSERLGHKLPFDDIAALRKQLGAAHPHLLAIDALPETDPSPLAQLADAPGRATSEAFGVAIGDFYLSNPIARASKIMAELSAMHARAANEKATGTHG